MTTTTPDMGLILPDVSVTAGPGWATLLNSAFTTVDSHDHSTGKGLQITPSGLNISSDLTFVQNNATNLRSARLYNNSSFTAGSSDLTCLYALNNELYYRDGSGNTIQFTSGGYLNVSASISTLSIKDTSFFIQNFSDTTKQFRFNASAIPTGTTRIISMPDSGANDTLVTLAATQTMTSKTLTSPAITAPTITGSGTISTANTFVDTTDSTKAFGVSTSGNSTGSSVILTFAGQSASGTVLNVPSFVSGDTMVLQNKSQIMTTKTINTSNLGTSTTFEDTTTATKKLAFSLSGATASTTLTLSSSQATSQTINIPAVSSTDTFVTAALAQTLTNKTLTAPVISSINTGSTTFTLPSSDGSSGQVIQTNGSAVLSFATVATTTGAFNSATNTGVTYTNASSRLQYISCSSAVRTDTLPTTSISAGDTWTFNNYGAYAITLQSSGANTVCIIPPLGQVVLTALISTPTTAANWLVALRQSQYSTYTPTIVGAGTVTSNVAYAKINGDSLIIQGSFITGTPTATTASISLPFGLTINSSKVSLSVATGSQSPIMGQAQISTTGGFGSLLACTSTSTSVAYFGAGSASSSAAIAQTGSTIFTSSTTVTYKVELPI